MKVEKHKCPACKKKHTTFENSTYCCLKTPLKKNQATRAEDLTKCSECSRVIPQGWQVKLQDKQARCLKH